MSFLYTLLFGNNLNFDKISQNSNYHLFFTVVHVLSLNIPISKGCLYYKDYNLVALSSSLLVQFSSPFKYKTLQISSRLRSKLIKLVKVILHQFLWITLNPRNFSRPHTLAKCLYIRSRPNNNIIGLSSILS